VEAEEEEVEAKAEFLREKVVSPEEGFFEEDEVEAEEEEMGSCTLGDGDRDGDTLERVDGRIGYTADTAKEDSSDEDEDGKGDEDIWDKEGKKEDEDGKKEDEDEEEVVNKEAGVEEEEEEEGGKDV
jgi:hypothetical protein